MESNYEKLKRLRLEYHQKLIDEIIKPRLPIDHGDYAIIDVYEKNYGVQIVKQYYDGRTNVVSPDHVLDELELICFMLY